MMTLHDETSSASSPQSKNSPDDNVEEEIPQQLLPPGGGFVGDQNQHQHQHLHHRVSLSPGAKTITSPPNANTSIVDTAHTNDSSAISISSSISVDSTQTPRRKLKKKTSTDEALVKSRAIEKSKSKSKMSSDTDVKKKQAEHHAVIKYGSLLLLVGQMVGLVLLMRYTRTRHSGNGSEDGDLYLASTAVFMMEIMKFLLCCAVVFHQKGSTLTNLRSEIHTHVCASPNEMLKLCVPSFLYTIQNNLLYLALTNLDAATYQILYQLKILTTALFSATMLGRRFSKTKWASLVVLTAGVALVQISGSSDHDGDGEDDDKNRLAGLFAVLCAACTSGFSGVYFEKILKGSETSLWIRNIQMGIPSMIIAWATVFLHDAEEVERKGFFVGYSPMVVLVITVQAVGGLIVAVVVKYADNVLKVFATSFSILLSCLISALVFDFRPNFKFLVGASLVILSTAMYSKPEKKRGLAQRGHVLPISHGTRKTSG
mmetsp:Transcript_30023/g.62901  ORF Transcript_30023/g.62901 Transcript_30023/m.62901 type:complete len:486 (+) Transcript_30023:322-1779(+)